MIRRLREAGFTVWPFDEPRLPLVVEIWPRIFYGRVKKSHPGERATYLRSDWPGLPPAAMDAAVGSDDAFDAVVSGLAMDRHRGELALLQRLEDRTSSIEGAIWKPSAS